MARSRSSILKSQSSVLTQTSSRPPPPVDLEHLARYIFNDADLEREVLQLFLGQLPATLAALSDAKSERDWKIASHSLKGAARNVGAWRLGLLAEEAERLSVNSDAGLRAESIADLTTAASEVREFIYARYRCQGV